jgi:hypothetical protein
MLPGFSSFVTAVPARPLDKCPRDGPDGCFTHWIPGNFSATAASGINLPQVNPGGAAYPHAGRPVFRPAIATAELVEVGIVVAKGVGTALPLINWRNVPTAAWTLTLDNSTGWLPAFANATLASTSAVVVWTVAGGNAFAFAMPVLEVGDALVLR